MPRPKKKRFVSGFPTVSVFVPQRIQVTGVVVLSIAELEAIRLADFERLDQETAAHMVGVSRQTFGRILGRARTVVSEALVTGKILKIEGGTYELRGEPMHRRPTGRRELGHPMKQTKRR